MGIFGSGKKNSKKVIKVFIVEDSKVYAAQLEFFLQERFGEGVDITCFPVAEVMDVKLEHQNFPDLIVMDNMLNDKYSDAETGIKSLLRIKSGYPGIELVLHSAEKMLYTEGHEELASSCYFIPKDENGMENIAALIEKLKIQAG